MSSNSVKDLLAKTIKVGTTVTVQGWVRTRRNSKAGISFIALSDGSCFDSLQLVIANTVDNYNEQVTKITTGCAIRASGEVVASLGQKQTVELQVQTIEVVG